ncbi:MAG: glycine cleavage T C-terminal barrel domain-containing protein [Terrimesophilobacter sp.]
MSTEFLALDGAVEASGVGAGVAAHYGNPMVEQRALAAGTAVVDLSHRGVLSITGPDRLTWLDSMSSQSIRGLQPGGSAETLLLGQTGRIEHDIRVLDDGVAAWLLVDGDDAEPLRAWLDSMRFMLRVEVADRTAEYATIGTLGTPPLTPAAPNGVALIWHDPWSAVTQGGYQYSTSTEHPASTWTYSEVLMERSALALAAKNTPAGLMALEALRIAAWRPSFRTEVDEKTIPHELDWLRSAVHLTKGCYRGQETVAKVHNLGHPPRRLVMLHLDGSDAVLPLEGDEVLLDDTVVGRITSVARHFELGPIALAVVKRSTDPDAVLSIPVGGVVVAAGQVVIVPPTAGAVADVPRIPRLR